MFGNSAQKSKDKIDHEKLGKAVEEALVKNYIQLLHSTRRQIWSSFVRGIFTGLGSVIGATVVVALLLWLLTALGGVIPGLGVFLDGVGQTMSGKANR